MVGERVTAIIVNHDQSVAVAEQLAGYRRLDPGRFAQIRWVVVSNGRTEPEPTPGVELRRLPNEGYGSAINHVVQGCSARAILALNADLAPEPGFLEAVLAAAKRMENSAERIGVVGFRLFDAEGTPQGSVGRFPTLVRFLWALLWPRSTRKYVRIGEGTRTPADWVTGACVLIDGRCFEEMGGFDPSYFLYYEDVDFCFRAARRGWRVEYDPAGSARHYFPYHRRRLTPRMVAVARRSLLLYFWRHRPRWEFHVLRGIIRTECRWRRRDPAWKQVSAFLAQVWDRPAEHRVDLADLPAE